MDILYKRTQWSGWRNFNSCSEDFQSSILQNNISRCHEIIQSLSPDEIEQLINAEIKRKKTVLHLAAKPNVELDIWKLLLPHSSDKVLYQVRYPRALYSLIPDVVDSCQSMPIRQLQKIRFWLELTKDISTKHVLTYRSLFLCKLCLLKGGDDPKDATLEDILSLAKDLIEKYKADPNGCETDYIPLHWAIEMSHVSLLSLFLSYGADVNSVDSADKTPLYYASLYQSRNSFKIACLMVDHGANLSADNPNSAIHSVIVALELTDLDTFMAKYSDIIKISSHQMLPFPIYHGLLLHSIVRSKYRSDRMKLQKNVKDKMKILLKHGLSLNMQDIHGRTILHYACWFRYALLVEFLVSLDHTLIQVPDSFGRLCIHYTIAYPSTTYAIVDEEEELSTLKVLLNLVDKQETQLLQTGDYLGRKVQHLCVFENNSRALTYLLDVGFAKNIVDNDRKSLEHYAEALQNECAPIAKSLNVDKYNRGSADFSLNAFSESNPAAKYTDSRDFITQLLYDTRIGPLKMTKDINNITESVTKLINKIAFELNKRDPRFQCDVVLAGSMSEQTKTNPPDEFDFQFRLNVLSKLFYIHRIESCNTAELWVDITKDVDLSDILKRHECMGCCIYRAFNATVYEIINCVEFWKDVPFYWCCCKVVKTSSHGHSTSIFEDLITPLQIKWIGHGKADVNISVDLVPVLVIESLPAENQAFIPRKIQTFVHEKSYYWHIICRESFGARLSFLDVERYILLRLVPELREVYQLAKSLRTYCDIQSKNECKMIKSYMLKNALFQELDPDGTYCLLENQLVSRSCSYPFHEFMLTILSRGVILPSNDRIAFIHFWTLKMLNRIEQDFVKDIANRMYCCPDDGFLGIAILKDENNEHPYLKALNIMKSTLGSFEYWI